MSSDEKIVNSKPINEAYCINDATARTINSDEADYSAYDDDYEDETTAKVEDYPISRKAGNYSIYDENGSCQVNLIILITK